MSNRPFLSLGIVDLENRFHHENDDVDFLDTLLHELKYRRTQRAKRLKARAETAKKSIIRFQSKTAGPSNFETSPVIEEFQSSKTSEAISIARKFDRAETDISGLNEQERILYAWTALEVLSPQSFLRPEELVSGDKLRITRLDKKLPWDGGGEKSRKNQRLYYQLILGTIDMSASIEALLTVYTDTRNERPQARGKSIIATVLVDKSGRIVQDDPISVSSFAWGLPVALSGDLKALGHWARAETPLKDGLQNLLTTYDNDGEIIPLTTERIQSAFSWIVSSLGLENSICTSPKIALKTYQYYRNEGPPETLLLNSFYLDDLSKARGKFSDDKASQNLRRYMGKIPPKNRQDILNNQQALTNAVRADKAPMASWPGNGRHSLVALQQAAVNLASANHGQDGILAVNGPPGTGKTTLLRDVVADILTERAKVMASYHDPEDAFSYSGERIKMGQAFLSMYELDEKLRGYEIVVASSNNKAVENVSAELPSIESVANDAFESGYLKTVSDALLGTETWGLIAAVLGNSKNRSNFSQNFWWHKDAGMSQYLKYCTGARPVIIEKDKNGEEYEREPDVIVNENPPSDKSEAKRQWLKAKSKFGKALALVETLTLELNATLKAQDELSVLGPDIKSAKEKLLVASDNLANSQSVYRNHQNLYEQTKVSLETSRRTYNHLQTRKPGFFSKIFSRMQYLAWKDDFLIALDSLNKAQANERKARQNATLSEQELTIARSEFEELKSRVIILSTQKETYQVQINEFF